MQINQLLVPEMANAYDSRAIIEVLNRLPGVRRVSVNSSDKAVRIEHDDSVSLSMLITAVKQAGYAEVSALV